MNEGFGLTVLLAVAPALASALLWPEALLSQPREWVVGVRVVDLGPAGVPDHLQKVKPRLLDNLNERVQDLFEATGRCRSRDAARIRRPTDDANADDYVAQVILRQLYKSYRNKEFLGIARDLRADHAPLYSPETTETRAEPILIGRLEFELLEARSGRVRWSASRDSTVTVPYGPYDYVINPSKYPDAIDPVIQEHFMADILRLSNVPGSPVRYTLDAADRWFISHPQEEVDTAAGLLMGLVGTFYQQLDGHLPLEGQIVELMTDEEGETHVALGIGTAHGVVENLKMDVWRSEPVGEKVGQIQVIEADSATAVARVRKIAKAVGKRGEGIRIGDRAISRKRRSSRRWAPQ